MIEMPRLAPDGVRCKEERITFGTAERKLLAIAIKEQKANRIQKYVSSFALPISIVSVAAGIGVAGYFMAPSIVQDAKDKLNEVIDGVKKITQATRGQNSDGSWTTVLCVSGPDEGKVNVDSGSGLPLGLGALSGVLFYAASSLNIGGNEWVGVWGNFNKNATRIEELTQPWWFLAPGGGPLY
jgi:hypothetical protein